MAAPRPERKPGVCAFIAERLRLGEDTATILARGKVTFPASHTTAGDVGTVRSKIRTAGAVGPS